MAPTRLEMSSNAGHACSGSVPVPVCGELLTGEVQLSEPLTAGLSLIYDSSTLPQPIIVLETFLQSASDVPDGIDAQLTFNASAGTTYSYDTTSLIAGDSLRFALQADATALSTGRYDYSVKLTADMTGTPVDHTYFCRARPQQLARRWRSA